MGELAYVPPKAPPPCRVVQLRSMSELAAVARRMPQGCALFVRTKEIDPPGPVPPASSVAPPLTLMVAFSASDTMAQGWMVTVAGELMEMLFGTEWVTPSPSQISLALMLLA